MWEESESRWTRLDNGLLKYIVVRIGGGDSEFRGGEADSRGDTVKSLER